MVNDSAVVSIYLECWGARGRWNHCGFCKEKVHGRRPRRTSCRCRNVAVLYVSCLRFSGYSSDALVLSKKLSSVYFVAAKRGSRWKVYRDLTSVPVSLSLFRSGRSSGWSFLQLVGVLFFTGTDAIVGWMWFKSARCCREHRAMVIIYVLRGCLRPRIPLKD